MKKLNFIQKFGGYVIDAAFCILAIWATVDYFIRGESHPTIQAAFAIIALYSFGVIWRVRSIVKQYERESDKYKKSL